MRFAPNDVLIQYAPSISSEVQIFANFEAGQLFSTRATSYVVESRKNNVIGIRVDANQLLPVLRSCNSKADSVILRLTSRDNQPLLSFDIGIHSSYASSSFKRSGTTQATVMDPLPATAGSNLITMTVEAPAEVLPHSRVDELAFPPDPVFSWNIEMPSCRALCRVLEGMKLLGAEEMELEVRKEGIGRSQEMLQNNDLQTCEVTLSAEMKSGLGVVRSKVTKRPLHNVSSHQQSSATQSQTEDNKKCVTSNFKVKQLLAAFEVGTHIPNDFVLARLVPKTCLYIWYPLIQMENCHVCVCVAAAASKTLDANDEN